MRLILRPSLLLLLAEKESHGYELFDQLSAFGFEPQRLDSSVIYPEGTEAIEEFYQNEGIRVVGKIPFDLAVTE